MFAGGLQAAADEVRQHGIVTADVAAWLSGKKLGAVYLAGLLHDVGKLLIYKSASTQKPIGMPSPELVEDIATEVHASIGVLVAHAWKLVQRSRQVSAFTTIRPRPPQNTWRRRAGGGRQHRDTHGGLESAGSRLRRAPWRC